MKTTTVNNTQRRGANAEGWLQMKLKDLVALSFAFFSVGMCNAQLSAKAPLQKQFCYTKSDGVQVCGSCDHQSTIEKSLGRGVMAYGSCEAVCNAPYKVGQIIIPLKGTNDTMTWSWTGPMCIDPSKMEHCYLGIGSVKVCEDQAFPQACQINADSTSNSLTFGLKHEIYEPSKRETMVLYDDYGKLTTQIQNHPCSWKCYQATQSAIVLIVAELKRRHEDGWIADKPNNFVPIRCIADDFYWTHVDPEGNFHF
ncbi:MAG: hypothetical protein ABSF28_13000 [Terracidiphilus sp.]|jgi:hypothetical protein